MADHISYGPQVTGAGTLPLVSRQGIEKLGETVRFCVDDWHIGIEGCHNHLLEDRCNRILTRYESPLDLIG
jgi:hypothetical protein